MVSSALRLSSSYNSDINYILIEEVKWCSDRRNPRPFEYATFLDRYTSTCISNVVMTEYIYTVHFDVDDVPYLVDTCLTGWNCQQKRSFILQLIPTNA